MCDISLTCHLPAIPRGTYSVGHVMEAAWMGSTVTDRQLAALGDILLRQGHCDQRTLDRARRVATESDQRLDAVLIQLGLVSERGLADAYAVLLSVSVASAERYPAAEPVTAGPLERGFPAPRPRYSA